MFTCTLIQLLRLKIWETAWQTDLNYVAIYHAKVNHCFHFNTLNDFLTKLLQSCTFICIKHYVFEQFMVSVCILSSLVIKLLNIRRYIRLRTLMKNAYAIWQLDNIYIWYIYTIQMTFLLFMQVYSTYNIGFTKKYKWNRVWICFHLYFFDSDRNHSDWIKYIEH